jgi:hypothetical protein
MPIPANVVKMVMRGTGYSGEIWQTGYWGVPGPAITTQAQLQTLTNAAVTPFTTFWNTIKSHIYTGFSWTGLTAYFYSGGTTAQFVARADVSASPGTLSAGGSPADTCLVVSTRTVQSGRSFRGRMYIPCHDTVAPGTGLWTTQASTYSTAVATLMLAVNGVGPPGMDARVVSRKLATASLITSVTADQLPDVQRRRENRMSKGTVATNSVFTPP